MYLLIQKRINYILTILFIFLAILLYILFFPIFRYWGFTGMIISFMTLILIFHFLIDNVIKHTEDIIIYRMLSKKQIALCQIKKVQFYKTKKDFYFRSHHIFSLDFFYFIITKINYLYISIIFYVIVSIESHKAIIRNPKGISFPLRPYRS